MTVAVDMTLRLGMPLRDGILPPGLSMVLASCGCITLAGFDYLQAFFEYTIRCPHCWASDPAYAERRLREEHDDDMRNITRG